MSLKPDFWFPAAILAGILAATGCTGPKGDAGTAASCTVRANADGTKTISCSDGTSATVSDGSNGTNGTSGTNGKDGTSCTVVNNGNGTRTINCGDGSTTTVFDAFVDFAAMTASEKAGAAMSAVATRVTIPDDGRPVVTIKVSDRRGYGVKGLTELAAGSTTALANTWRFGLLKLVPGLDKSASQTGVNGSANDTWVSYMAANDHTVASTETAVKANMTDNGDGTYTYRFDKVVTAGASAAGTTYEADKVHRLVVLISASGNPFSPVDVVKDFVPSTGADVNGQNDKVDGAACIECHGTFRATAGAAGKLGTGVIHGGSRYDIRSCVACHNDQKRFTSTGATVAEIAVAADGTWTGNANVIHGESYLNFPVYIHKIHMGERLTLNGGAYQGFPKPYEVRFPQDVRNCRKCHRSTAAMADNYMNKPSRRACGACHDNISYVFPAPAKRIMHMGGAQADDSKCLDCHSSTSDYGAGTIHQRVALPDPASAAHVAGGNANTNAAYVAATGYVPPGAKRITYEVKSVSAYSDTSVEPNAWRPQIVFRLMIQDPNASPLPEPAPVVFNTYAGTSTPEMLDNFVGSPSAYFAFAVPQDGKNTPADYNATASGYLKNLWNGTASGTGAGSLSGPDAEGNYTVKLTGIAIPANATMLTGGLGYTYSLTSSPPLTQVNLSTYPYTKVDATGLYEGGLIVPAPNVGKAASGCAPGTPGGPPAGFCQSRRAIVEAARCNNCHGALGAEPTFHSGQRNDGATCSFCHTPNRTNSGWSVNARYYIHAIHGAAKRTQKFTWGQKSTSDGFWLTTYPSVLNRCEACHAPGTYDFSATASAAAVPNLLYGTVAAGTFAAGSNHSPYVEEAKDYGSAFSASNITSGTWNGKACSKAEPCVCTPAQPCAADKTTLVTSPIALICSSCHDSAQARDHMQSQGASFYQPREAALAKAELCMLCHGPGTVGSISARHAAKP